MTLEQKNNTIAWSITIGVHLLLLLLFFFIKYSTPYTPPIEELGMEVNLGTSEDGYGFEQPEWAGDPAAIEESISSSSSTGEENVRPSYTSPDGEDVLPTRPQPTERANQTTRRDNTQSTNVAATPQNPRYTYENRSGEGGNTGTNNIEGGSEGNTTGTGDRGVPEGTVGAENYEGAPGRGNVRYSLRGRSMVSRPNDQASFNQGGTVKITITVDNNGKILPGYIIEAPNAQLRRLAEEKLKSVRFNAVPPGPPEAGIIYFDFKVGR